MNFDWYCNHFDKKINDITSLKINCFSILKLLNICDSENVKKSHKELVYGLRNPKKDEKPIIPKYPTLINESLGLMEILDLKVPIINIPLFPLFSFFIQFTFYLATPYLSRDDEEFYICENPVRKEKVFKVPMVSGSTWKGNLRWTARRLLNLNYDESDEPEIIRLFGNKKGQEDHFRRGRLNFYPTFFTQIGLEVINPHDRKTKAGTQPIYIESVPEGAKGIFSLLYVPFDLMGKLEAEIKEEVAEDLNIICASVKEMMLMYGFSAKKSSGFGIVKNELFDLFCEMEGIDLKKIENTKLTFKDIENRVNEIIAKLLSPLNIESSHG